MKDLKRALVAEPGYTLTLRLTLVLALVYGASWSAVDMPTRLLATLLLVFPRVLLQPALWWLLTTLLAVGNAHDWYLVETHQYVLTYWVLACTLSLHVRDHQAWLGSVGRVLTLLIFGFAVLWKIVGGEFLSGSVVYYTLLTDPRWIPASATVGDLRFTDVSLIPSAVSFLGSQGSVGSALVLPTVPILFAIALALSWLALGCQGLVGAVHVTGGARLYKIRHLFLMMYVVLAYGWLPVVGFAAVLLLLGLAQCRSDDGRMRLRYVVLLFLVHLPMIPWT